MNNLKLLIIMVFGNILLTTAFKNNVCKSFSDYYTNLDENKNCYYNPDRDLSTADIIKRHGYPAETYKVTTDDGYILTVFRIQYSKNSSAERVIRKPVFLQHGLTLSSACFINIGKNSMGFYLSDAGYDVWLGNFRGNKYNLQHQTLNASDDKFWNYSFHEHGLYDLPAQLNLVKQITKQKVGYIGYSMGCTSAFLYSSLLPKQASENIKYFIALAPAISTRNIWSQLYAKPLLRVLNYIKSPTAFQSFLKLFCFTYPFQVELCVNLEMLLEGFNYEQLNPETLPIIYQRDFTSPKVIFHYFQLTTGKFKQYDYGSKENLIKYGSSSPPVYNLSNINFPVQLVAAPNDQAATVRNVRRLYQELPERATRNTTVYIIKNKKFNHSSFIVGKDAKHLVFDIVLRFLDQIL